MLAALRPPYASAAHAPAWLAAVAGLAESLPGGPPASGARAVSATAPAADAPSGRQSGQWQAAPACDGRPPMGQPWAADGDAANSGAAEAEALAGELMAATGACFERIVSELHRVRDARLDSPGALPVGCSLSWMHRLQKCLYDTVPVVPPGWLCKSAPSCAHHKLHGRPCRAAPLHAHARPRLQASLAAPDGVVRADAAAAAIARAPAAAAAAGLARDDSRSLGAPAGTPRRAGSGALSLELGRSAAAAAAAAWRANPAFLRRRRSGGGGGGGGAGGAPPPAAGARRAERGGFSFSKP